MLPSRKFTRPSWPAATIRRRLSLDGSASSSALGHPLWGEVHFLSVHLPVASRVSNVEIRQPPQHRMHQRPCCDFLRLGGRVPDLLGALHRLASVFVIAAGERQERVEQTLLVVAPRPRPLAVRVLAARFRRPPRMTACRAKAMLRDSP